MWELIAQITPYAVAYTMPLLITALGGLVAERSGVVNIALDGLMLVGSFAGALAITLQQPSQGAGAIWAGIAAGAVAGALFSLLHAFASITLRANQVISGTAVNILAGALTVLLARNVTGSGNIGVEGLRRFDVPGLSEVPVIGPLLFRDAYATTWLVLLILVLSWFILYRTVFGLRLRACGENPLAVDAAGVPVNRIRYLAVLVSGAFAGLGGVIMLVTYSGEFNGSVFGLGFLALAALIFGQWNPWGILGATFFFGFAATIANISQVTLVFQHIPPVVLKVFPYVATLVALVLCSGQSRAPRAVGEPFEKSKR